MHYLDRSKANVPSCLQRFRHPANTWADVTHQDRAEIWVELRKIQGELCAYCEGSLSGGRHIDHFRPRSASPKQTFNWSNLYGSCELSDSCGRYKDTRTFNPDELIEPGRDNPDEYLVFAVDGSIAPRRRQGARDERRERKFHRTLTVLNLDAVYGPLRWARQEVAEGYLVLIDEAMRELSPEDIQRWARQEIARTATEPHPTVIRHLLEASVAA